MILGVKILQESTRKRYYIAECNACGAIKEMRRDSVEKAESCGCLRNKRKLGKPGKRKLTSGESNFNNLFNKYTHKAKTRGLFWCISKDVFRTLTSGACYYCGVEPLQSSNTAQFLKYGLYLYNGIDRVDNTIGYLPENCVTCCWLCNKAKNTLSVAEFKNWLDRLINYQLLVRAAVQ